MSVWRSEYKTCTECEVEKHWSEFALVGKPIRRDGIIPRRAVCMVCMNEKLQAKRLQGRREILEKLCPVCGSSPEQANIRGEPLRELKAKQKGAELLTIVLNLHSLSTSRLIENPLFDSLAAQAEKLLADICGRRWISEQREAAEKARLKKEQGRKDGSKWLLDSKG